MKEIRMDYSEYESMVELIKKQLGNDISEINLHSDDALTELNRLIEGTGNEVHWFVDIKVNTYK